MVCDICKKVCEPNTEFCVFIFTGFGLVQGQLTPRGIQEEYCDFCTKKVKAAVDEIKKQINETPALAR